jgi:hypothetical protein
MQNREKLFIFISLVLSFFFIVLSFYPEYWINFFGSLSIPPQIPAFSDLEAHSKFLKCKELGLSLYDSCSEIILGSKYNTHPSSWVGIFKFLNLNNINNFKIFVFFLLTFYFISLFHISKSILNYKDKLIFLLAVLSTSNLLLIERLATDCIIFLILFTLILNIRNFYKYFLFFFSIILKIYPVFVLPLFSGNRKDFFIALIVCFLGLFFLKDDILNINNNLIEFARVFGYGSRSISRGIYLFLNKYNYSIIENYNILKNLIILFFLFFVLIILLMGFFNKGLKKINYQDCFYINECKLFILGSSVYIFTFVFGSNADYRLIFLFLTLPYVLNYYQNTKKITFLFCLFVSLNSLYFEKGYEYSLTYYMNVSFVYFCKLILLSYLSFTLGHIMKNYIFFKNKFI